MTDLLESIDARGVATLTLNRPDRHNAFDDALIGDMTRALRRLEAMPGLRALVLASTGKSFSAGADVGWMRRMAGYSEAENLADAQALAGLMNTLDRFRLPTIALVQGAAYGGGVGLAACCDIVIASENASFCLSEVKLGLTPATISPYVVRAIGARQARRYFATAEAFSASRAREIGLVHEVIGPGGLESACEQMIAAILHGAPGAQAEAKDLVFLCLDRAHGPELALETAQRIAARRASVEGREGLGAFIERRKPVWQS